MFIPWASWQGALISSITSLLILLWIAIGGNVSRLNNLYMIPQLSLSVEGCGASRWNLTAEHLSTNYVNIETTEHEEKIDNSMSWWTHLPIYEISYMW